MCNKMEQRKQGIIMTEPNKEEIIKRIGFLQKMQYEFEVTWLNKEENKPSTWTKLSKYIYPKETIQFRQQLDNELIIELDAPTQKENNEIWFKKIKPILIENKINFEAWVTQSKSIHINLFFERKINNQEREAFIKTKFNKKTREFLDNSFWTKEGKGQLIAMEHAIHYKSKEPKILIEKTKEHKNIFPKIKISKEIKEKATKPKITKSILEILQTPKANNEERCSVVMKLFNAHKNDNWKEQEIMDYIEQHNKWKNFEYMTTYKYAMGIINKYSKKPNPFEKQTEQPSYSNKIELKNYKYFEKLKKDKRFLVQDFLYPDTVNMLYSPPAQFKSIIALHLALQISTGKPFMELKTTKYPILLCDKENNEQLIKERFTKLRKGHEIKNKNFPLWYITRNGDLQDSEFIKDLKNNIKEKKIKLVIFDTLHRFADYEENKADDINQLYNNVFQPIREIGCAILYLHHTTKQGDYRGSSDFLGMVDSAYLVKRRGKTEKFNLICEKSRSGEIEEMTGIIDFQDDLMKIERIEQDEEKTENRTKFLEAADMIKGMFSIQGDSVKASEIYTEHAMRKEKGETEMSKETVRKALRWLVRKEFLDTPKKGIYTRKWEVDEDL